MLKNKKIFISSPYIDKDDKKFVAETLRKNEISTYGKNVLEFENKVSKITDAKYNLALNSGTSALLLSFKAIGLKENDIVITQSYTFVATTNSIIHCGATPWLFDISKENFNINIENVEKSLKNNCYKKGSYYFHKINKKRIFAICPVFSFSIIPNLKKIKQIAKKYNLKIIFDGACSIGAKFDGKSIIKHSDMCVFSFNGNKTITTGAGGLISTENKIFFKKAKIYSQNGKINSNYEYKYFGHNYRMSSIHASIGLAQLKKFILIKNKKNKIRSIYEKYFKRKKINFLPRTNNSNYILWINCILLKNKKNLLKLTKLFRKNNIESKFFWKPMHLQINMKSKFIIEKQMKFTNLIWDKIFTLPSCPNLSLQNQRKIISIINKIYD